MKEMNNGNIIELIPCEYISDLEYYSSIIKDDGVYIAGGALRSNIEGVSPNDIDLYFRDECAYDRMWSYFNNRLDFTIESISPNVYRAINKVTGEKVDLIGFMFGEPVDIISRFDFTVSKLILFKDNGKLRLLANENTLFHIEDRVLHIDNEVVNPPGTINRIAKYKLYGYSIDKGSMFTLMNKIKRMDVNTLFELSLSDYSDELSIINN